MVSTQKMPGQYVDDRPRVHRRNAVLIRAHGGRVLKFRDLPRTAQLALVQYMALDGEAWELAPSLDSGTEEFRRRHDRGRDGLTETTTRAWEKTLAKFLPFYVGKYEGFDFGHLKAVPMSALIANVMQDGDDMREDWGGDWKKYHEWYKGHGYKHQAIGDDPWPVVLGGFHDETLEDGWNRFHLYYDQGRTHIPAVWFPMRQSRAGAAHYRKLYA
jgi:hypothetical protein